ncbi:hypothetical protein [Verminephrobacter eiseniae]|uniref:hypothetical protein n=1 Tax=Verminephrobacter eiseniae TaxID=364317 RepID=UPI001E3EB5F7|nr:hypothetical protein [Verminephrobacter eiseniae]
MSRHRSSVGLRWPSKRIAALHRLPIRSVWAARCALRCAPMAARSLRHLIRDATLVSGQSIAAGRWRMVWRRCQPSFLWCSPGDSPAAARSAAALSVRSQVNSGSSRPKWP